MIGVGVYIDTTPDSHVLDRSIPFINRIMINHSRTVSAIIMGLVHQRISQPIIFLFMLKISLDITQNTPDILDRLGNIFRSTSRVTTP